MKKTAVLNETSPRIRLFMIGRRLIGLCVAALFTVTACGIVLSYAPNRPVLAQAASCADLAAIARQYPKYTKEQQMAVLRARTAMLHPSWRGVSIFKMLDHYLKALAKPRATTSAQSVAPFAGNLTEITPPGSDYPFLMRQSDCSLTLTDVHFSSPNGTVLNVTIDGTTPDYGNILHAEAGLSTAAGTFPNGCSSPDLGISTRVGVYLGTTAQNLPLFAGAAYYAMQGTNALYYGTYNPSTGAAAYTVDTSDPNIIAITAGDLNGDGLADVVAIDQLSTSSSVSVRLAQSNGSIAAGVSYPVIGQTSLSAVVDDVNGDGKADVVVASVDAAKNEYISILTGNGDGTLNPAVAVPVPTPTYPTAAGNSGPGGPPVIEGTAPILIANLTTADLRGTGHKDIVTSNGIVLLNNGSGAFTVAANPAFTARLGSSSSLPNLAAGDLNGDHKQDIVLNDGQEISIFMGNGDGTFTPGATYASPFDAGYVTVTDLDGDGNADVYLGLANGGFLGGYQFAQSQAYAMMGNGDGTLRGAPTVPFVYSGSNLVDLNNDGKLDGVGLSASGFTDVVTFTSYLGKGDGTFAAKSVLPVSPATIGGQICYFGSVDSFAFGDFNGDGFADLVYLPESCGSGIFIATGKGDGSFNAPGYIPTTIPYSTISSVHVADLNHDGMPDLLYTYYTNNDLGSSASAAGLAVQLSNGDGTFQAPQLVQTSVSTASQGGASNPLIQTVGDVNGDGFPDIFITQLPVCSSTGCGSGNTYQFELLLGNGDGTFQTPYTMPPNPAATGGIVDTFSQVILADMNGDGHPDVVALGQVSLGGLGIYLGKGDGTFATPSNLNFAGLGLAVADFNDDGKLDVAITSVDDSGIFPGNGDGTVQSTTDSNGYTQPVQTLLFDDFFNPAVAADFNGDGKPDLLFSSTLLLNQVSSSTAPTLLATTTSLTASPTTTSSGQSITFTATVAPSTGSGTPTGSVTFYDGTASLGNGTISSGVATFATSSLSVASHSITATYSGDSTYNTSTSAVVSVSVTKPLLVTTTTLAASSTSAIAGTSLTFTAMVAPSSGAVAPTGTVTFYDGTTSIGTGTLASGSAAFSTTVLAVGSHSITAGYGGDTGNAASTSSAVAVTITAAATGDFSIGLSPSSGTVAPGSSVTSAISITPTGGFNQQVTLACSEAPQGVACTIAPSTVTPTGTAAATATLTLQANVNSAALNSPMNPDSSHHPDRQVAFALTGFAGLLTIVSARKRYRVLSRTHLVTAAILFAASAALGCGGSSHTTPGGTSTVTITATAGATTHTATYALSIQ